MLLNSVFIAGYFVAIHDNVLSGGQILLDILPLLLLIVATIPVLVSGRPVPSLLNLIFIVVEPGHIKWQSVMIFSIGVFIVDGLVMIMSAREATTTKMCIRTWLVLLRRLSTSW